MNIRQLFLGRIRLINQGSPLVVSTKGTVSRPVTGATIETGHCAPKSAVPTYPIIQVG